MKHTKKDLTSLPKNIQLTLITTTAIAFVVNAITFSWLLFRVYPHGIRLSQFSIMAVGQILLPVLLFSLAFFLVKHEGGRFNRVFTTTVTTITGLAIYTIIVTVEILLSRFHDIYSGILPVEWIALAAYAVTIAFYLSLLLFIRLRSESQHKKTVTLALLVVAFLATAMSNVYNLTLQRLDGQLVINLFTNPLIITPVILPIAFFMTAYLMVFHKSRLARSYIAAIYTLIGIFVITITTMLFNYAIWLQVVEDAASAYPHLQTTVVAVVSLAVYSFLIITHNSAKKAVTKLKKA
jgi:hypothetical protein